MAILDVLRFPDERLRTVAAPVEAFTPELQHIVDDMFETMYAEEGIGLAATQVDIHQRIIVIDVSENREEQLVLINPEILEQSGSTGIEEGCLSIPEYFDKVERPARVRIRYLNRDGEQVEEEASGLYAVCIQHEMDHLNGVLFIDHLSRLKRDRAVTKVKKAARDRIAA
mgnify:CR=1 FL=1